MDKLQQYYESLPLCTGNTPGNVMFSVYNDIDNLDSLTRWFDLPDDEAYNKVPKISLIIPHSSAVPPVRSWPGNFPLF